MKNIYRQVATAAGWMFLIVALSACSRSISYNDAVQKNIRRADNPDMHDDARFVADAASYHLLVTQMAEQAIESGYSAALVRLAQETLKQQEDMLKDLKRIARREDMVLPTKMRDQHEQMLSELKSTGRDQFDRTFTRILMDVNRDDRAKFEQMATNGESADVRAFAARQIGFFNNYQDQLRTVDAELLRTY
jgi:putative membrane protein